MTKRLTFSLTTAAVSITACLLMIFQSPEPLTSSMQSPSIVHTRKMPKSVLMPLMAEYQFQKLRDPATDRIPPNIRSRELSFASRLPVATMSREQNWTLRGPTNIGGRMLCIAIDIDDESHLLAGSASGGMWQSTDAGQSWQKTTAPDAEQSATCIVQDRRAGKHHIWYYGTGELLSTTNRNISTNVRTVGIGNGIFKSTDNGASWVPLASTLGGSPEVLTEIFQGVWRIATDPVSTDKDIVYAACYGAIMRSENGGATWQVVLGDLPSKSFCTDIAITSDGILYALLSGYGWGVEPPDKAGIWRSVNGISWTNITPTGFPADNRVSRLALAPSNNNVMYVFTESQSTDMAPFNGYANTVNTFWKMTWDEEADTAIWEDRTPGMKGAGNGDINSFPNSFVVYGGYTFTMGVKPDNEDVVFIGGLNVYRSENGFADSLQTTYIGGYPFDMDSLHGLHPDEHGIAFLHSDPSVMFLASDGGIYVTQNCMADSMDNSWTRLNNKLTTTQFYSVAIDHGPANDNWILGGLQDNNWYYTVTDNPSELWFDIDICYDGFATCVADDWEYCVISAYSGNIWTTQFDDDMHTKNIFYQLPDTLLAYYDPVMGTNSLFPFYQNFALDPNTDEIFYLPTVTSIWRKNNMKAASYDTNLRNVGWTHLSNVDIGQASDISYLAVSTTPPNRLYYGTSLGKLFRLDDAHTGNPIPVDITGDNFPPNAFLAFIDIDPGNADHAMVVFSNYGVQSLFHTSDGGATWIAEGGNLEEHPDGSGSGPSVRCVKKVEREGREAIFIGTSVGLFSTSELKGDSTIWVKEGASSIGNVIVDMIDSRSSDGFMAVGTHGNGVYSTHFEPTAGIDVPAPESPLMLVRIFPNPAHGSAQVEISCETSQALEIHLYNNAGKLEAVLFSDRVLQGTQTIPLNLNKFVPGLYQLCLLTSDGKIVKKIIVL
ncbi:MAG: T9SS type A sorting domain-containing protein [Lentimicrobiaceae bacterium]|nr:T9SS type A sorting domain-containing protein [Lentimicrobiaceae bacterium]